MDVMPACSSLRLLTLQRLNSSHLTSERANGVGAYLRRTSPEIQDPAPERRQILDLRTEIERKHEMKRLASIPEGSGFHPRSGRFLPQDRRLENLVVDVFGVVILPPAIRV